MAIWKRKKAAGRAPDNLPPGVRLARTLDGHSDVVWDHMPAALVASEAGCDVSHFDGSPVSFTPQEAVAFRGGVVCCRGSEGEALRLRLDELTGHAR